MAEQSTAELNYSANHGLRRNNESGFTRKIPGLVHELREVFEAGRTRSLDWRRAQLSGLARLLKERESEIFEALRADLGKPEIETYIGEIASVSKDLAAVRKNLARWMRPERVAAPLTMRPGRGQILKEPLGVVLIIAPWNYPLQLSIGPLVGALAAGNCAVLKPSEVSPATSALLARLLPAYVDATAVKVLEGGVELTTELLEQRFDHIFFTGSAGVGRVVMTAAARHLTPVTLELGGKSPCIVADDANLDVAARRIAWGKFFNAGQTCIAPDYILVHKAVEDALVTRLKETVRQFYGEDPRLSRDYARVVNKRHLARLAALLTRDNGVIAFGGQVDEGDRYLAPTVLRDVSPDSPVMAEEIFGPILPVLAVESIDQAVGFVNSRPKPLALYVFSENRALAGQVIDSTSSGGAGINNVCMQAAVADLPFGGVGASGMGAYHGRMTFETFTHRKSVFDKPTYLDPALAYPPVDDRTAKWLKRLM